MACWGVSQFIQEGRSPDRQHSPYRGGAEALNGQALRCLGIDSLGSCPEHADILVGTHVARSRLCPMECWLVMAAQVCSLVPKPRFCLCFVGP